MTARVEASGRRPARIAWCADAPDKHEFSDNEHFAGPAGTILWQMAWRECGLERGASWNTSLLKVRMEEEWRKKGVPAAVLEQFGAELEEELLGVRPEIVVAVGRYAARHFLGEWANMQTCNARMWEIKRPWGTVKVLPMMHPAAAIRDSSQLAWTQEAMKTLRAVIRGETVVPVPTEHHVTVYTDWAEYLDCTWAFNADTVALDTEWLSDGRPWGLSFAADAQNALVVRAGQQADLDNLAYWLQTRQPRVALHYALADLEPLRRMGIDIRAMGLEIVDTNILAFHQQTEPQGLKALCRRHLGLKMRDYEDVVGPYHREAMFQYLAGALAATTPEWVERRGKPTKKEPEGKRLKSVLAAASPLHARLKRAMGDAGKKDDVDLYVRWQEWPDEIVTECARLVGPAPAYDLRLVPRAEAVQYSGEDAAGTIGVLAALEQMRPSPAIEVMDHGKLAQVDDMQSVGLQVDEPGRVKLQAHIAEEMQQTLDVMRALTERADFNPASRDEVAEVLFGYDKAEGTQVWNPDDEDDYVMPVKFTRTGLPATDKKSLSLLSKQHVLPPLLLYWRQLQKLQTTYIVPLPGFMRGGVLYPRYSVTRVPSGRLAARDPNIMAFPKRSKLGKMVRGLFVARPGRMFGAWDHGQIELRVMADDARDERMIAELLPGAPDMHTDNASRFFGIPVGDIDPKGTVRDASKIITYGIAYGAEAERLHFEALVAGFDQYTVDDFTRFRAEWFRKYSGVAAMVRETEELCARQGYIEDRWGRARKLPGVAVRGNRWPMSKIREEAIRQGQNHRVQGGAQGFMVRAMLRWPEVRDVVAAAGYTADLLLQIHDELMVEFDQGAWEVLDPMMQWAMTADSDLLKCGVITDSNQGATWADL